jgi:hypothetical protein
MKTLLICSALCASSAMAQTAFPPPKNVGDAATFGRNIQRTMTLLESSTAQKRNTVKVLFYGQSITEQAWWKTVADDLKKRYPHANLIIENRALGGFSSQRLVKTAESDLYSFYPDLMIFHVYGAHDDYENIIRRTRERTTAEILIQTDHLSAKDTLDEETDAAKITNFRPWPAFMNYVHLPSVAKKYNTGMVDQRNLWKAYLRDNNLTPDALLRDGTHLNAHGEFLMAELAKAALVKRADETIDPYNCDTVKTYVVGRDVQWQNGKLVLPFNGNRVDAILKSDDGPAVTIAIDGKRPSKIAELYSFTRALSNPGGKWPVISKIGYEKTPLLEEWTMQVTKDAVDEKRFTFTLQGSKTGADGAGNSGERFVSKSGRVVIEPKDWDVEYALGLPGIKPVPEKFTVRWKVLLHSTDVYIPLPPMLDEGLTSGAKESDRNIETILPLAQGLNNGAHTLEISGTAQTPIAALRVYRPPFGRE